MYGINAGYDTRPMATGYADTGIPISNTARTVFFQQAAVNAEAVSDFWSFNAYALLPTGIKDAQLNSVYQGGSLKLQASTDWMRVTTLLMPSTALTEPTSYDEALLLPAR